MRIMNALTLVGTLLSCAIVTDFAQSATDEIRVRERLEQYVSAYNKGDVRLAASLFADQKRAEKYLSVKFIGPWKGSRLTLTMPRVQLQSPSLAVGWVDYSVVGYHRPDGREVGLVNGHGGIIMKKKRGVWFLIPAEGTMPLNMESYASETK